MKNSYTNLLIGIVLLIIIPVTQADLAASDSNLQIITAGILEGYATVPEGIGIDPNIKYSWVLPDDSSEQGMQMDIVPSGERNDIYACIAVGDEDSRDTIVGVFVDLYHPDSSFKYQIHAKQLDPTENKQEILDCISLANDAGLLRSNDTALIKYNICR